MLQFNYMGFYFHIVFIILIHVKSFSKDNNINELNSEMTFESIEFDKNGLNLKAFQYKKDNLDLIISCINSFIIGDLNLEDINFIYYGKKHAYFFICKNIRIKKDIYEIENIKLKYNKLNLLVDNIKYDLVKDICFVDNLHIINNSLLPYEYSGDLIYHGDSSSIKFSNSKFYFFNFEIPLPLMYYHRSELKSFFLPMIYSGINQKKYEYLGGRFHLFNKNFDLKLGIFSALKKDFYNDLLFETTFRLFELKITYARFLKSKIFEYNFTNDVFKLFLDYRNLKSNIILLGSDFDFSFFFKQNTISNKTNDLIYKYRLKKDKSINFEDIYYIKILNLFGYKNDSRDRTHKIFLDFEGQFIEFFIKNKTVTINHYGYTLINCANFYIKNYYLQIDLGTKENCSSWPFQYKFDSLKKMNIKTNTINFLKKINYIGELYLNDDFRLKVIANTVGYPNYINLKAVGIMFTPFLGSLEISFKDIFHIKKRKISITYDFNEICLDLYLFDLSGHFQFGMKWNQYIKDIPFNISLLGCYDKRFKNFFKFGLNFILFAYNINIGYIFLDRKISVSSLMPNSLTIYPSLDFNAIHNDLNKLFIQLKQLKQDIDHKVKIVDF